MADGEDRQVLKALKQLAGRSPPDVVDAALAERLVRRGLARHHGERLQLTDTGAHFLRRALADADGFAAQHQDRVEAVIDDDLLGKRSVIVNQDESPLSRLRRQKGRDGRPLIDATEFAAGERLRVDYTRGQLMPRVTANWGAAVALSRRDGGAGGMADLTLAAIGARRRVEDALAAVGPDLAGVLVDFCCFLKGIEEIERERAWPVRSAKLVLRLALAALARHYGLSRVAHGTASTGALRHWGTEDFRPLIE